MPWVSFDATTGETVVESEQDVFVRGVMCNQIFTQMGSDFTQMCSEMSLHDRRDLLYLLYESTRAQQYDNTELKPGCGPQTRGIKHD